MICIAPADGASVDPAELLTVLSPRMARFMTPRFVRIMNDLLKTPSSKIKKQVLRSEGVAEDTWDREAGSRAPRGES